MLGRSRSRLWKPGLKNSNARSLTLPAQSRERQRAEIRAEIKKVIILFIFSLDPKPSYVIKDISDRDDFLKINSEITGGARCAGKLYG